MDITESVF